MEPPIYELCRASEAVRAVFGDEPRIYPHGSGGEAVVEPYAVWSVIAGEPSNSLGDIPSSDYFYVQIDVWGDERMNVLSAAKAVRDAIEVGADIEAWRGASRDKETEKYCISFDANFYVARN